MTGTCNVTPEIYVDRKSASGPKGSLSGWVAPLAYLFALALTIVICVQMIRGAVHEYQGKVAALQLAEARAERAELQVAELLKHGDKGTLVARIGPDLSGYELRLVPAAGQKGYGR